MVMQQNSPVLHRDMFKIRTGPEFLRAFFINCSKYPEKCRKVLLKMLNPSVIEKDFRNNSFAQNRGLNTGHVSHLDAINKSIINGGKCNDGLHGDDSPGGNVHDLRSLNLMLKKIFECRDQHITSWLIERKVNELCELFTCMPDHIRNQFIEGLAEGNAPQLLWLLGEIGKMEKGPGYLVNLRADLINLIAKKKNNKNSCLRLHELNATLRELLSVLFSHNCLQLERITSTSSKEILEKISKYERVHPVRDWTDLMRRVGPYRRCFVFLHHSMLEEPIIILHVALTDVISSRVTDILCIDNEPGTSTGIAQAEDSAKLGAAVFYSLSLAQKGLKGIGISYYLIRQVGIQIQKEFPRITQFSTLSPIYTFKIWFLRKLEKMKAGHNDILLPEEVEKLKVYFDHSNYLEQLNEILSSNAWFMHERLRDLLREPLVRACARYLYLEKTSRGYAIDSAANLHLKNGAVMWRINWMANPHDRGLNSSFGLMVNYRYYFHEMETNGIEYQEEKKIAASDQVIDLVTSAKNLMLKPKVTSKI